jgi:uncharacterized membrane protein YcaP (DUF421 family)
MNKEIRPFDIQRMLFGDAPPWFLIEVLLRGLILYLFMLFVMRLLGKRMAGELTVTEMVLMVTLGSSVAVAIQVPEGGVLLGFVVLSCAYLFEKGFSFLTIKSKKLEELSQGKVAVLVKDGVLQLHKMKDTRVTPQQIFATLRGKNIYNLGKVERLYLEAGGEFSVYKTANRSSPGLPIYPSDDKDIADLQEIVADVKACSICGCTTKNQELTACLECEMNEWVDAVN